MIDGVEETDHGLCFLERGSTGLDLLGLGVVDTVQQLVGELSYLVGHVILFIDL